METVHNSSGHCSFQAFSVTSMVEDTVVVPVPKDTKGTEKPVPKRDGDVTAIHAFRASRNLP
jgi:hypothetical protein